MYITGNDLYDLLINKLAENEDSRKSSPRYFTMDGNEILCGSESDAIALADFLEAVCGFEMHVGYYYPKEDAANGETDFCTGKWCVYAAG